MLERQILVRTKIYWNYRTLRSLFLMTLNKWQLMIRPTSLSIHYLFINEYIYISIYPDKVKTIIIRGWMSAECFEVSIGSISLKTGEV